ncbi:MAG TPA: hypothetical protein VE029_03500, partial [Rhizobacter sp.]|nr:hypothetical protein [Rhizobacter sp.]
MMNVFGDGVKGRGGWGWPAWMSALILGLLAGCATESDIGPPATDTRPPASLPSANPPPVAAAPRVVLQRPRARWVSADWSELPGWDADLLADWWPALLRGCDKPVPEWTRVCS